MLKQLKRRIQKKQEVKKPQGVTPNRSKKVREEKISDVRTSPTKEPGNEHTADSRALVVNSPLKRRHGDKGMQLYLYIYKTEKCVLLLVLLASLSFIP